MRKIQTDRQFKGSLLTAWTAMSVICGVAICYAAGISGISMLTVTGLIWMILCIVPLLTTIAVWALSNQINRGLRYMWRHYNLQLRLRRQLLDAGFYNIINVGKTKLAQLPWIKIDFESDYKSGRVYIENSVAFSDRLSKADISPALGDYVVEQIYLTKNQNHYFFDFYDATREQRFKFNSYEEFRKYAVKAGAYELFVDRYTKKLPLAHHLMVGQTGSGKTYALHGLLLQMLLKPVKYQLYFCDPKASSISLLGEKISPENTADNYADIIEVLEKFVSAMEKRQLEMREHLKDKIDGDYRDFALSPHILIIDEYAAFSLQLQAKDKKHRDHVHDLISQIVLKGRQSGFYIWIVMQQAGSNNIPTYLRDNLPWKTVLGNAEDQTYVTAYGAGVDIPARKMEIGEGVYTYPGLANKPKLCAYPTLDFDVLDALK